MAQNYDTLFAKIAKWEDNPIYFIEKYCQLKDQKFGRAIPFKLWKCQKEQMEIWQNHKRCISLKTRQIGISWLSAAFMLHQMIFKKFYEAMVLSRKEADAIKYLDKVKFMYSHLPDFFKNAFAPLARQSTRLSMEFANGSCAMAESSNPEAGRSETLNLLIMDEAAFIPDSYSVWNAAEPTLEKTDGLAIFISTGNGYDRLFQPIWEGAENEGNGFKRYFISWEGDPNRNKEWYKLRKQQAERQNRIREFRAEYPRNPVESFIVTGQTFFSPEIIEYYLNLKQPKFDRGILKKGRSPLTGELAPTFELHGHANLKVWKQPTNGSHYCIGVDCAEGVADGDYSVAAVYDRQTREQVAEYAGRIPTEEFGRELLNLAQFYNTALINIEMNSVGDSIMNFIVKQRHYPHIYRQMRYDERGGKKVKKLGWRTTITSKRTLIDALDAYLKEREMHPRSEEFFGELKTFVVNQTERGSITYGASGNKHDDRVIAHALCAICFQEKPLAKPSTRPTSYKGRDRFARKLREHKQLTLGDIS